MGNFCFSKLFRILKNATLPSVLFIFKNILESEQTFYFTSINFFPIKHVLKFD